MQFCRTLDGVEFNYWICHPLFLIKPHRYDMMKIPEEVPLIESDSRLRVNYLGSRDRGIYLSISEPKIVIKRRPIHTGMVEVEHYTTLPKDNDHFAKFYGYQILDDNVYIRLQYIKGVTMNTYLGSGYSRDFETIVTQGYEALDQMHAAGVFHGDIGNPDNVILSKDNRLVIIDFETDLKLNSRLICSDVFDLTWLFFEILAPVVDETEYNYISDKVLIDGEYGVLLPHIYKTKDTIVSRALDEMILRLEKCINLID